MFKLQTATGSKQLSSDTTLLEATDGECVNWILKGQSS